MSNDTGRADHSDVQPPTLTIDDHATPATVTLNGDWTLRGLCAVGTDARQRLLALHGRADDSWDLTGIRRLDHTGALMLWRAWQRRFPERLGLLPEHRSVFDNWSRRAAPGTPPAGPSLSERATRTLAQPARALLDHSTGWLALLGRFGADCGALLAHPGRIPWREISATIHVAGTRAMAITGVLGLLFGIVLAYQAAMHLRGYGAGIFVADMLGFTMVREMGPSLTAIVLAGRSGSAITAQIGVMRLTQELDAMKVMGISISQRLILPKIIGLVIVVPLLSLWVTVLALAGGALTSQLTLGLGLQHFIETLPRTLPWVNLWIGMGKAALFGAVIAITACHFGLRIQPNTRSLAFETTRSVVVGIALVIILNASSTILLQDIGYKGL